MGNGFVYSTADSGIAAHRADAAIVSLTINRTVVGWVVWQRVTAMIAPEVVIDVEHVGQQWFRWPAKCAKWNWLMLKQLVSISTTEIRVCRSSSRRKKNVSARATHRRKQLRDGKKIDWKQLNFEWGDKRGWCKGWESEINADVPFTQLHLVHLLFLLLVVADRNGRTLIRLLSWPRHSQEAWKPIEKHHSNLKWVFMRRAYEKFSDDEMKWKWMSERRMEKGNNWLAFSTLNMHGMRMINTSRANEMERVRPKRMLRHEKKRLNPSELSRSTLGHVCNVVWPFSCKFRPIYYSALHQLLTLVTGARDGATAQMARWAQCSLIKFGRSLQKPSSMNSSWIVASDTMMQQDYITHIKCCRFVQMLRHQIKINSPPWTEMLQKQNFALS